MVGINRQGQKIKDKMQKECRKNRHDLSFSGVNSIVVNNSERHLLGLRSAVALLAIKDKVKR